MLSASYPTSFSEQLMNRTKQILIVEDDTRIATALAVRLNAAGYEVLTAPDGVQGLQLALNHRPDLIVMDIWMPVGLGLSVAQRLQSLGLGHIPIIVMTASKLEGLQQAAEEVGAVAFFEKPYNADELLKTIARTLKPDRTQAAHHGSKHPTSMAA
jgi:two-component system cell cycle response regulator